LRGARSRAPHRTAARKQQEQRATRGTNARRRRLLDRRLVRRRRQRDKPKETATRVIISEYAEDATLLMETIAALQAFR